ncbi:hypothetical protein BC829DRAFT_424082 [Chytridium lagenaria]|nr:hypothetical protein BC829DRAFT_424082 [Chytridium lagenaria]
MKRASSIKTDPYVEVLDEAPRGRSKVADGQQTEVWWRNIGAIMQVYLTPEQISVIEGDGKRPILAVADELKKYLKAMPSRPTNSLEKELSYIVNQYKEAWAETTHFLSLEGRDGLYRTQDIRWDTDRNSYKIPFKNTKDKRLYFSNPVPPRTLDQANSTSNDPKNVFDDTEYKRYLEREDQPKVTIKRRLTIVTIWAEMLTTIRSNDSGEPKDHFEEGDDIFIRKLEMSKLVQTSNNHGRPEDAQEKTPSPVKGQRNRTSR